MKLLAKLGIAALAGSAALVVSATGDASNAQAQADYNAIKSAQAMARAQNDIIKLNCVNDKLVLAKAILNIIDGGDTQQLGQLHELRVAAEYCAGKNEITDTNGTNSFTSPPGAAEPSTDWNDWGTTFEPGVNASPSSPTSKTNRFSSSFHRRR